MSMQNKLLDEDEAAVGSVYGSQEKIPEGTEREESEGAPDLILDIAPFHIANLRDRRGKPFKVIYRETEDHVQIEVHRP